MTAETKSNVWEAAAFLIYKEAFPDAERFLAAPWTLQGKLRGELGDCRFSTFHVPQAFLALTYLSFVDKFNMLNK